ncbi:uncharacterized protein F5891DRAFT_513998 [Suillus fuscotomentosus]|uniref:Uncharacterized protein n=1 Tax=Suillus fuscotomentosus TaxID=1912939 RepID=A0AAD4E131_9AGAM|nr:uncharacterized protein F5891DRAFT_513998 [Suillus fuscotomentosus]KAG1897682.1 hypothetical protein F5891DRAFT_513998 [Suillus fuscotomentosus]
MLNVITFSVLSSVVLDNHFLEQHALSLAASFPMDLERTVEGTVCASDQLKSTSGLVKASMNNNECPGRHWTTDKIIVFVQQLRQRFIIHTSH